MHSSKQDEPDLPLPRLITRFLQPQLFVSNVAAAAQLAPQARDSSGIRHDFP